MPSTRGTSHRSNEQATRRPDAHAPRNSHTIDEKGRTGTVWASFSARDGARFGPDRDTFYGVLRRMAGTP